MFEKAFTKIANHVAYATGTPVAFVLCCTIVVVWAVTGPLFGFSDTWQLIINTGTTIVTFLMVFLMQNTQNRDTISIQLKLDELIRANENARNAMLSLEDLTEDQLARIKATFDRIGAKAPGGLSRKLRQASEDLEAAGEDVEQAQEKLLDAAEEFAAHDNAKAS